MKTFQLQGEMNTLEFTNYERIAEVDLLNRILQALKDNPNMKVGEKQIGPSEDYYYCAFNENPFILYFDLNYGPSIYAKDVELISALKDYFDSIN